MYVFYIILFIFFLHEQASRGPVSYTHLYFVFVFSECVGDLLCVGVVVCECDVFIVLCVDGILCFVVFVFHAFV